MNYDQCLAVVKAQNPKMPHREQQTAASGMLKEFKASQKALASGDLPYATKPGEEELGDSEVSVKTVTRHELLAAEKKIRSGALDANNIVTVGREVMSDGRLVNHGKAEDLVNSRVTFEDGKGNRIPVAGEFVIYI
jgi:hypothetical protein